MGQPKTLQRPDDTTARYTEAEYAKVCNAADYAEAAATELAARNDAIARDLERERTALKGANAMIRELTKQRDTWKELRIAGLKETEFWQEEAARRILRNTDMRLLVWDDKGIAGASEARAVIGTALLMRAGKR